MRLPFPSFLSFGFKIFSSDPDYRHPLSAFAYGLNKHDFSELLRRRREMMVETEGCCMSRVEEKGCVMLEWVEDQVMGMSS